VLPGARAPRVRAALGQAGPLKQAHVPPEGPGSLGQGFESQGGFTVLRGAQARREFVESIPAAWVQARAQLVSQGVFLENPAGLTLAQDYEITTALYATLGPR
jgi:hypothetical protein